MRKILLLLSLITVVIHARGQWNGNSAVNNPIVTTSNNTSKSGLVSINDGNNNMIIAWEDSRNSGTTGTDIYVQKINNDGTLPWGAGKVICSADYDQTEISLTLDGEGGVILAWGDKRAN